MARRVYRCALCGEHYEAEATAERHLLVTHKNDLIGAHIHEVEVHD